MQKIHEEKKPRRSGRLATFMLVGLCPLFGLGACDKDVGDEIEDVGEEIGDEVEDAGDEIGGGE